MLKNNIFEIRLSKTSNSRGWRDYEMYIDGISLLEIVREAELVYYKNKKYAGNYRWMGEDGLISFFSQLDEDEKMRSGQKKRIVILCCECGNPMCWDWETYISYDKGCIVWNSFYNQHRPQWKYENLSPYRFEKTQYIKEIKKAEQWFDEYLAM